MISPFRSEFRDDDPYDDPWGPDPVGDGDVKPPPEASAAPPPADGGGRGSGGGGGAWNPSGKPTFNFGPVPIFDAPGFEPPDPEKIGDLPGYQFRLDQGTKALERSAAARGTLRTGGTLKDITEYGQSFASQEYNNEFNRALQTFNTNYMGLRDEYAPLFAQWQMMSSAELQAALAAYNRDTVWHNPHAGRGGGGGGGTPIIPFDEAHPYDLFGQPAGYGRYR